jgi:glucan phosphoethanolaminetransferase (alkaline phosphatase superfamily)
MGLRGGENLDLVRLLLLAAWISPTIALIGGGLPADRIFAAFAAAGLSGVLICALPSAGFRVARLVTLIVSPLSLMWIAYVCLDGMGPTPRDALFTLANTDTREALSAVHLLANGKSISLGLTHITLLAGSYVCGRPHQSRYATPVVAAALFLLMALAWIPRLLADAPSFLPGRDDLQNFPYGSMADILGDLADEHSVVRIGWGEASERHVPHEAAVQQRIDAIFVVGESHRYARSAGLENEGPGWESLKERFQANLGVWLPKVCASSDSTAISVPMLLSGTPPDHDRDVARAPSGLARLASAGYETAWISNQPEIFFEDEHRDLVWVAKGYSRKYDEALLPVAKLFLNRNLQTNKALIIHLMDSHAPYDDRYPTMAEPEGLDEEQRDALQYQRANDHTLTVLSRIAFMIDALATPAFVIYVSDHGENLLTDHNGLRYHFGTRTSAKAAYVPSIVLWNSAFLRAFDPMERLRPLLAAPSLAHADVYHMWMNFALLPDRISITPDPKIMGKQTLTSDSRATVCADLLP